MRVTVRVTVRVTALAPTRFYTLQDSRCSVLKCGGVEGLRV